MAELPDDSDVFRLMVDSVKDYAIFLLDPNGIVLTWNQGAQRLKGYKSDEIIGKHFSIFYTEEAKAIHHPEHELELALRNGVYEEEGLRVRKDGSTFWASVVITPLSDRQGKNIGFTKVTRDLTEKRRYEQRLEESAEKLRQANADLERASKAKDIFLANMSHELRTPLNSIIGFIGVLLMELSGPMTPTQKKQGEYVKRAAEHLLSLINDILDLAKIESGKLQLNIGRVDVCTIVSDVVAALEPQATQRELFVTIKPLPANCLVAGEERAVRQILTNLIANALKFTDQGGVTISVKPQGDKVNVAVQDTGIGIAQADKDKLFKGFVQLARGARTQEGTGLGLLLSKRLATLMHGDITFESEFGHGSTFTVSLPAYNENK